MSPAPLIWVTAALMTAAVIAHAVRDHHYHLVMLRRFRPGTAVPQTARDGWWHRLSRPRKAAFTVALLAAGGLAGMAWVLSPVAAGVSYATVAVSAVAVTVIRMAAWHRAPAAGNVDFAGQAVDRR